MGIDEITEFVRLGETSFIEKLSAIVSRRNDTESGRLVIGIGDDAAYIRINGGTFFTTDALVDGVHFRVGEISWFDLGWKAIVASQSDVSAMGGVPTFVTITLGLPADIHHQHIENVYRGMEAALGMFGGYCIGGDIVKSPVLFINAAMIGQAYHREKVDSILRRDRARVGDEVAVTGPLGGSAGGFTALQRGMKLPDDHPLIAAHFRPRPKVKEAQILVEAKVKCAMDISDGLVADLEKLAFASKVGAILCTDKVRPHEMVETLFPEERLNMALSGGEDYELLFTAEPKIMDRVLELLPTGAHRVGEITNPPVKCAEPRIRVLDARGQPFHLEKIGWDHLA